VRVINVGKCGSKQKALCTLTTAQMWNYNRKLYVESRDATWLEKRGSTPLGILPLVIGILPTPNGNLPTPIAIGKLPKPVGNLPKPIGNFPTPTGSLPIANRQFTNANRQFTNIIESLFKKS
jgi:hypothetical protein